MDSVRIIPGTYEVTHNNRTFTVKKITGGPFAGIWDIMEDGKWIADRPSKNEAFSFVKLYAKRAA